MAKIGNVQEISIEKLKPYEKNAKQHGPEQVEKIADSIKEFGFLNPCLIDENYNVIAGHGRIMAAKKIGRLTVPCLFVEGLTEEQRKAYVLADNRLTEMGEWDSELVSSELQDLQASGFDINLTGFNIDDIIIDENMGADISGDEIEEIIQGESRVHQGDVWILGKHRLMCGDSTKMEDVEKLMGGGLADLLITDPPYGVSYEGGTGMTIENDSLVDDDFIKFLTDAFKAANAHMKNGAAFYIWHADSRRDCFLAACKAVSWPIREVLVWVKNSLVLGRQDYQWRHEPCLYGWKDGAGHYFVDLRSLTTVDDKKLDEMSREDAIRELKKLLEISTIQYEDKPLRNGDHPTMKPIPLFERLIRNSSQEGNTVLDLFGGSGTTLIACEQMNRKCCIMEFDEKYAEVILERWEALTGEKAELLKEE